MIGKVNVPIKDVLPNVTVTVKITGLIKWRFQVWIARQLFRLGAVIANINLDFKRTK